MTDEHTSPDLPSDIAFAVGVLAVATAAMALVALVLPIAARPMISLVAALGLVAVTFVTVRKLARDVRNDESPFDHDRRSTASDLPTELQAILRDVQAVRGDDSIPEFLAERLRRSALRRLRQRHDADARTEQDWRRLSTLVSPELYLVLTGDVTAVPGRSIAHLVEEVERL